MATIEYISSDDERLDAYRHLTDVPVRSALEVEQGRFVLEGLLVLQRAVDSGVIPEHVLVSERMLPRVQELLAERDVSVLVATDEVLQETTGYHVHRGVLADARRPPLPELDQVLSGATFVLLLEALRDHANVGAAFRNAAALGVDCVLVTKDCADPLYRRAVKTSMGAVLQVPWTLVQDVPSAAVALKGQGMQVVALTPAADAAALPAVALQPLPRALCVGTEGAGLSAAALAASDVRVRIPMSPGPDSLNAAAATAIALYAFGPSAARPDSLA